MHILLDILSGSQINDHNIVCVRLDKSLTKAFLESGCAELLRRVVGGRDLPHMF